MGRGRAALRLGGPLFLACSSLLNSHGELGKGFAAAETAPARAPTWRDLSHSRDGLEAVKVAFRALKESGDPPEELCLGGCDLGDEGGKWIAAELQGSTSLSRLVRLDLTGNHISGGGAGALLRGLRSHPPPLLSCLVLDFNPIGESGLQSVAALLQDGQSPPLRSMSLRFCDLGPSSCRSLASGMMKAALSSGDGGAAGKEGQGSGGLDTLILAGNHLLGDAGARALAAALQRGARLKHLDLSRCGLGDEGATYIARSLASGASIASLTLAYNKIGPNGAAALADALENERCALKVLDLGSNPIGNEGAISLSRGIGASQTLRGLCITNCRIGSAGACALASGIAQSRHLEALDLSGNCITLSAETAAMTAAASTKASARQAGAAVVSSLNRLYSQLVDDTGGVPQLSPAGGETVPACGLEALSKSLRQAPSLRILGLASTGLSARDARKLAVALQWSPQIQVVDVSMNGPASETSRAWVEESLRARDEGRVGDFGLARGSKKKKLRRGTPKSASLSPLGSEEDEGEDEDEAEEHDSFRGEEDYDSDDAVGEGKLLWGRDEGTSSSFEEQLGSNESEERPRDDAESNHTAHTEEDESNDWDVGRVNYDDDGDDDGDFSDENED